jgi:DNA-binding MarR family transcriptional regulator
MPDINAQVVRTLRIARKELVRQYDERLANIDRAIASFNGDGGESEERRYAISDDKVDAIRQLLKAEGRLQQRDITRLSELNSGTVSVALRALEADGEIRQRPKENGSRVWEYVFVEAEATA